MSGEPPARPGSSSATWAVELLGVTKRYGDVLANDSVDLRVAPGEIHALVGENGAGKSTLMSILFGLVQPDAGTIRLHGSDRQFGSSDDAIAAGLGMVHQSFRLFGSLSVAENVVYGHEPRRRGFIDRRAAVARVAELADAHGLAVDPRARVDTLPVGVRQRVEILKALYRDANVLILDEPTATLTPAETETLFAVLRDMAGERRTVVIVTHKLDEVMAISDRATVMRDGRVVDVLETSQTTPRDIARAMTGRDVLIDVDHDLAAPGVDVLAVDGLRVDQPHGARPIVDDVSLSVRAGEVVGIAGVAGNGQSELIEAITGLRRHDAGSIRLNGRDVTRASVRERRASGMAYIPEDRHRTGTAGAATVADNLAFGFHRRPPIARRGFLDRRAIRQHAERLIARFGIKVASPDLAVGSLSGGNLQKVVVARELSREAPLLIAEQPTRGVDIGAIEYLHRALIEYRDTGHAVLLVSNEMSEVLSLSDRIIVMFEGRVVGELDRADATEQRLGQLMLGLTDRPAPV